MTLASQAPGVTGIDGDCPGRTAHLVTSDVPSPPHTHTHAQSMSRGLGSRNSPSSFTPRVWIWPNRVTLDEALDVSEPVSWLQSGGSGRFQQQGL